MSKILQLIRDKLTTWSTRGCGKRYFRDHGKLEAWQAVIPTVWQNERRGKLRAWQTRGMANLRNLSLKTSAQTSGVTNLSYETCGQTRGRDKLVACVPAEL